MPGTFQIAHAGAGAQGPEPSSGTFLGHRPGAGSAVEQLGQEQAPIWAAGATDGGSAWHDTARAPSNSDHLIRLSANTPEKAAQDGQLTWEIHVELPSELETSVEGFPFFVFQIK